MQRKRETRPESLQAKGRATQKSDAIVSQPVRFSKEDERLFFAAGIATFAIITWCEAGAIPAVLGTVTSVALIKLYEVIIS